MNQKTIAFCLITISTLSHGMEKIFESKNASEILLCITKHLCPANITGKTRQYQYASLQNNLNILGKNINRLSRANTFLHTYYSNEKTAQAITRCIASHGLDNEICISHYLGTYNDHFRTVRDKIRKLNRIACRPEQQFSKEDLSDDWYLNATESPESHTPLWCAYFIFQPQKIEILLNAKANARHSTNNEILNKIARRRSKSLSSSQDIQKLPVLLTTAGLLLQHGADPNFRLNNDPTPLMIAVCGNDKAYAHLLLWHNADPYKTGMWIDSSLKNSFEIEKERNEKNAFDMEPTGWLQHMVDEGKNIILNCAWFKLYGTQPECTLLPELVQLIIYNTWNIGKTYNEK